MARSAESIDAIIAKAVTSSIARIVPQIHKQIAALAAEQLDRELKLRKGRGGRSGPRRARLRPEELSKWVADRRARRVPRFVIEATSLKTKKQIVAKFGPNASFEKGKPLPPVKGSKSAPKESAARVVTAKPPIIRKAAK